MELKDIISAKQALSKDLLLIGEEGFKMKLPTLRIRAAASQAPLNVHSIGIGYKVVQDEVTKDLCIRLHVVQKLPESILGKSVLPKEINGIPTDVIESPPAYVGNNGNCSGHRRSKQRPIVAGISAGHFDITAGTVGYFCYSTNQNDPSGEVYLLSNNHVFADVNQATHGDAIFQPGVADGGTSVDAIGTFHRTVHIHLGGITPNHVDAAIAAISPNINYNSEICSIGRVSGIESASLNMSVKKHGRTSEYTEGWVTDINYDTIVGMDHQNPNILALFEDQIRIDKKQTFPHFGLGGDSGSLVVEDNNKAIGLYFAGPDSGAYGVANPIEDVEKELEIKLL